MEIKHNQFEIESITFGQNSNKMKKIAALLIPLSILACGDVKQAAEVHISQDDAFNQFKEQMVLDLWKQNPVWASYEGFHKYNDELPAPTEERRSETEQFWNQIEMVIDTFNLDQLEKGNQIDYYLIKDQVASSRFYENEYKSGEWNPSSYNIGGAFYQVINYRDLSLEERLKAIFKKLDLVDAYYEAAKSNIKTSTEVHYNLALQQLEGSKSIFNENLLDSLSISNLDETFKNDFTAKNEKAIEAIQGFIQFLKDDLAPSLIEKTKDFRIGEKLHSEKFKSDIQSGFTAEEIFQYALAEKVILHQKMQAASNELWTKYYEGEVKPEDSLTLIRKVIEAVSQTHVHRDSFITSIRQQIPELEKFVQDKDLITLDPNKPLVVRETPKYMRGFAGASISAPGPYDKNAETYYNVTPLDHYTEEQAESYLREYNHYTLQILNIHEAVPGHYTQLVYSNQSPSIIKSLFGNGAMIEGWAVYTELMMLENGYGKNNPEMMLMYYKWNLRTVCNTILDYGIHANNLSEEDAMDLLMNQAFQEKSEAEGKWKRARLSQVQLCSYFTGFYEIRALREEMKEKLGDKFDLKEFHEEFLSFGSAPVKYIRELMLKNVE